MLVPEDELLGAGSLVELLVVLGQLLRVIRGRVRSLGACPVLAAQDMTLGIRDGQDPLESGSVVCGNDQLFDPLRKIIRGEA